MATLNVSTASYPGIKQKAIEDARSVQASVAKECVDAGREPPPYTLSELIGKGSFGRVYKAIAVKSRQPVAVKIISIDEGDSIAPGAADTFQDILKEVETLKVLSGAGAKNINTVLDTLLVGPTIWIVTEYCGGGSVSTLMRPTGGLPEKWIVPILREVAEAIYWVHEQGIIHRDIKCANVFITEAGGVQLGDFGVAGVMQSKFDKRTTVTGTLQWMAPELFDSAVSYGSEVDIWAFGSMAYEVATGLPPNATTIVDIAEFGSYLRQHCPRLEGERYSPKLKDLVAYCLAYDPGERPRIEQVQRHAYIHDTSAEYPTSSLLQLVSAYKTWEMQGGSRLSLFSAGGAHGPAADGPPVDGSDSALSDEWNFNTVGEDQLAINGTEVETIHNAYGVDAGMLSNPPSKWQPRRRRPPNLKPLRGPLERAFDPNTISSYGENVRGFYGRPHAAPAIDNSQRENSELRTARESLIDLDIAIAGGNEVADMNTIRPGVVSSNPEGLGRRRTQEWTFPSMTATSASLDTTPSQIGSEEDTHPTAGLLLLGPAVEQSGSHAAPGPQSNRISTISLIDLDASLPDVTADVTRPSTAGSETYSTSPFDLEQHTSRVLPPPSGSRIPSLYIFNHNTDPTSLSASMVRSPPPPTQELEAHEDPNTTKLSMLRVPLPSLPTPPSADTMLGLSSPQEVREELHRMISSLGEHIQLTSDVLGILQEHSAANRHSA